MLPKCLANFIDEWKRPEILINNNPDVPMLELESVVGEDGKEKLGGESGRQVKGELFAGNDKAFEWLLGTIQAIKFKRDTVHEGEYLWELIYPKGPNGMPAINPSGKYYVKCFVMDQWRTVVVDDRIPVDLFGRPLPVGIRPVQLWPLILSKAVIKLMVAYNVLDHSCPHHIPAFQWLTGWPIEEITSLERPVNEKDGKLFDRVEEVMPDPNYVVSACLNERAASDRPPPRMLILVGPDAVGTEDIIDLILNEYGEAFGLTVSHTTRPPLEHEVDGETFSFATEEKMQEEIEEGLFLETAWIQKHSKGIPGKYLYGTSLSTVREVAATGRLCVMSIDVQGCKTLYAREGVDAMYVYLKAPTVEELEKRQRKRLKEAESTVQKRLAHAADQIEQSKEEGLFTNIVVNDLYDDVFYALKVAIAVLSPIIRNRLYGLPAYVLDYSDIIPANTVEEPDIKPVAIVGPTTTEKQELIQSLVEEFPEVFGFAKQYTTRPVEDGDEMHIQLSEEEFEEFVKEGKFVEHRSDLFVHPYLVKKHGTTMAHMDEVLKQDRLCILDLDCEQVKQMKEQGIDFLSIFLDPPSLKVFEDRLRRWLAEPDLAIEGMLKASDVNEKAAVESGIFDAFITYEGKEQAYDEVKEVVSTYRPDIIRPKGKQVEKQNQPPIVICGPSGVGKGTLIEKLKADYPEQFGFSVSSTTRDPRPGEEDGVHYHFTDRESMEKEIEEGKFLEHADVHGNFYGTSVEAVTSVAAEGKMCILDIDVQGAASCKKGFRERAIKNALFVFIAPPSLEKLEARLRGRGTEEEEAIQKRLGNAQGEMDRAKEPGFFDFTIVNDELDAAYLDLKDVIAKHSPDIIKPAPDPLILVGPMGVGKQALMDRIMKEHPDSFAAPVPHTTRAPREGEAPGQGFLFIGKEEFDEMERANKFIMVERVVGTGIDEAYGVARTVMKKIGHDGIIPVLEVDNVRTAEGLKAAGVEGTYVFVAPDSMEAVKQRLTDEIKASCPEGYGPGELHSVEEAVDLRLAHIKTEVELAHTRREMFQFRVANDLTEAGYSQLMEAVSIHAPDAVPAHEVWGYGQSLWDQTVRTYGRPIVRISIIGPAASGKTHQAKDLQKRFGIPYIYPGELVAAEVKAKTELGLEAKVYLDTTKVVPEDIIVQIIKKRMDQDDCIARGWMLDGFPHTLKESEALTRGGIFPDKVIFLECKHAELFERVKGRKLDPVTSHVYYVAPEGSDRKPILPLTAEGETDQEVLDRLGIRHDDNLRNVRNRLAAYDRLDSEMRTEFCNISTYIDGDQDTETIFQSMQAFITLEDRLKDSIKVTPSRELKEFQYVVVETMKFKRESLCHLRQDTGPEPGEMFWVEMQDLATNCKCFLINPNHHSFDHTEFQTRLEFESIPPSDIIMVDSPEPIKLFSSLNVGTQFTFPTLLDPLPKSKVLLLCGPEGIGVGGMVQQLLADYPEKFEVPKEEMQEIEELDEENDEMVTVKRPDADFLFLDPERHEGIMFAEIDRITTAGKMCILDVKYKQLERFKESGLENVSIFFEPASLGELDTMLRDIGTYEEEALQDHLREAKALLEKPDAFFQTTIVKRKKDPIGCYNAIKSTIAPAWPKPIKSVDSHMSIEVYDWSSPTPGDNLLRFKTYTAATRRLTLPRGKHILKFFADQELLYSGSFRSHTPFSFGNVYDILEREEVPVFKSAGESGALEPNAWAVLSRYGFRVAEPTDLIASFKVGNRKASVCSRLCFIDNDTGRVDLLDTGFMGPSKLSPNEHGYTFQVVQQTPSAVDAAPWEFAACTSTAVEVAQVPTDRLVDAADSYHSNYSLTLFKYVLTAKERGLLAFNIELAWAAPEVPEEGAEGGAEGEEEARPPPPAPPPDAVFDLFVIEVGEGGEQAVKTQWQAKKSLTCDAYVIEVPEAGSKYVLAAQLNAAECDFEIKPNGDIPMELKWALDINPAAAGFGIEKDTTRDDFFASTLAAWNEKSADGAGRPGKASEAFGAYSTAQGADGAPAETKPVEEGEPLALDPAKHTVVRPAAAPKQNQPPIVICGPSGVGKGTLIEKLKADYPEQFGFSVSSTTRDPRPGEEDGVHYHFTDRESMEKEIEEGKFLEHADVHGNFYGTSVEAVTSVAAEGKMCILDIDVQGAASCKKGFRERAIKNALFVFIAPPSLEKLEARLRGRGTEEEEAIQKRLGNAQGEMDRAKEPGFFDFTIVNDELDAAYLDLKDVIAKHSPSVIKPLLSSADREARRAKVVDDAERFKQMKADYKTKEDQSKENLEVLFARQAAAYSDWQAQSMVTLRRARDSRAAYLKSKKPQPVAPAEGEEADAEGKENATA